MRIQLECRVLVPFLCHKFCIYIIVQRPLFLKELLVIQIVDIGEYALEKVFARVFLDGFTKGNLFFFGRFFFWFVGRAICPTLHVIRLSSIGCRVASIKRLLGRSTTLIPRWMSLLFIEQTVVD